MNKAPHLRRLLYGERVWGRPMGVQPRSGGA